MTTSVKSVVSAIMSNGVREHTHPEAVRLIGLINLFCALIGALSLVMALVNLWGGNLEFTIILASLFLVELVIAGYLRFTGDHVVVSHVNLTCTNLLAVYLLLTGGVENNGHLWMFMLAPLTIFVFGLKKGLTYMLVLEVCMVFLFFGPGSQLLVTSYLMSFKIRFFIAFSGVVLFAAVAEYSRQQTHWHLLQLLEEQRRAELQRWELEAQLRQSQKLEAVGRLAGGIAHDFNNLLTGIITYAGFVHDQLGANSRAKEDLSVIVDAARRGGDLTSQLLAFGSKQAIRLKVLDLNEIVQDAAQAIRQMVGENITFEINADPNLGCVLADPNQMRQVFMNLVDNAKEAMPLGGRLAVRTENVFLEEAFCRAKGGGSPGEHVALKVSDTGLGMGESTKTKIFDPFFTTKKKGVGAGLGLSTVYGIAKQNKGYIDVQSEPDEGTSISVYLPRVYEAQTKSSHPPEIVAHGSGRQTILLAEDEDIVRRSAVRMLAAKNYVVLEAASGEEALEIAAAHPGKIDLLLTDVIMGGINGNVLAEELLRDRPDTRVLFMSGYTEDVIAEQGAILSDTLFLEKPFNADDLLIMTQRALGSPV